MPIIKSAIKRVKTTEKANAKNSSQLSKMRTAVKKFEKAKNKIKNLLSRIKWFKVAASAISLGASITASVATGNPLLLVISHVWLLV